MNQPRHPRFPEVMLEALDPGSEFREALLGDLAEEFVMRSERDGNAAARRWYYREAIRGVPYLLLATCRHLRARDALDVARATLLSLVLVTVLSAFLNVIVSGVAVALGTSLADLTRNSALTIIGPGVGGAMLGGYIAARLYARAPLLAAAVLCAVWSNLSVAALLVADGALPAVYSAAPVVIVTGTMAGGILRAWRSDRRKVSI